MTAPGEDTRCERTDLYVSQCGHCRPTPEPELIDLVITNRFPARFPGQCPVCDGRIREDDNIGRTEDGEYVCEKCCQDASTDP